MAARLALALSVAFLCLVLGWVSAPAPPSVVAPTRALRFADLRLAPAAAAAAAAAAALADSAPAPTGVTVATVAARSPGRAPPPPLPPPLPPPPPQADAVLRGSVAAVTEEGGRLTLVLAGGGRRLAAGERFMGWTLASVSRNGAVLTRGGARRDVAFFAPAAAGIPAGSTPLTPLGPAAAPTLTRRARAPTTRAPTADEFFRGFKG